MKFSVLTPTYNRAHTLPRLRESLRKQTCQDFEWIIVDDGSTDGTLNLVSSWGVRYYRKTNGGKHTAVNRGVLLARAEYTVIVDSDDEMTPDALETFRCYADGHPHLNALSKKPDGTPIGRDLPAEVIDAESFKEQIALRIESLDAVRTDICKLFLFPEDERFVPESLIWNRMSRHHPIRFLNKRLRIVHESPDSLCKRNVQLRLASPRANFAYLQELLHSSAPFSHRAKAAANMLRFRMLSASRIIRDALHRGTTSQPSGRQSRTLLP